MTSAKLSDIFTPPPFVTVTNQLILFLLSAFWGPPSPHPMRTSYMEAPLRKVSVPFSFLVGTSIATQRIHS